MRQRTAIVWTQDKGLVQSDKYTTCLLFLSKKSKLREAYSFQKHYYLSLSLFA